MIWAPHRFFFRLDVGLPRICYRMEPAPLGQAKTLWFPQHRKTSYNKKTLPTNRNCSIQVLSTTTTTTAAAAAAATTTTTTTATATATATTTTTTTTTTILYVMSTELQRLGQAHCLAGTNPFFGMTLAALAIIFCFAAACFWREFGVRQRDIIWASSNTAWPPYPGTDSWV